MVDPMKPAGAFAAPEPWEQAYAKTPEAKSALGQLLTQMIGQSKEKVKSAGGNPDWKTNLGTALYSGGLKMMQAGAKPGSSFAGAFGQGLGGAAEGLTDDRQKRAKSQASATSSLDEMKLKAAALASPRKSGPKAGKAVTFKDLMYLTKENGSGIIDPANLRKNAIEYAPHIKDDQFGQAYLQNTFKELHARKKSGELTPEEASDYETLYNIFSGSAE